MFVTLTERDTTILGKCKSNLAALLNAKQIADRFWNSHLTLGRDFHRHCIPQKRPHQNCSFHSVPMVRPSTKFMEITMHQTQHWQPATLAAALGVPEEAFRAFARLRRLRLIAGGVAEIGTAHRRGREAWARGLLARGMVPMFLLLPQVKLTKRLDVKGAAERGLRRLPGRFVAAWAAEAGRPR